MKVEEKATLNLSSGTYLFNEMDLKKEATLNLDVSGGPIIIDVSKDVAMQEGVFTSANGPGQRHSVHG